jgi:hypothetical protein
MSERISVKAPSFILQEFYVFVFYHCNFLASLNQPVLGTRNPSLPELALIKLVCGHFGYSQLFPAIPSYSRAVPGCDHSGYLRLLLGASTSHC